MQKRILAILSAGAVGLLLAGPAGAQTAKKGVKVGGASDPIDLLVQPVTDWLERANREYQDNVIGELSVPTGKGTALEASKAAPVAGGKAAPANGGQQSLIDQVKGYLGIETAKTPDADPGTAAETAKRDEALKRQLEARKLEQERNAELERNAEQQRIAAEAKKAADVADLTTKQNQKAAENARLAEEERRKTGGKPPASTKTAEASSTKADEKAAAERKAAAAGEKAAADKTDGERKAVAAADKAASEKADAERKAVAAAEKSAADKAAAERKAVAEAQEAKRQRDEAELKDKKQKVQAAAESAKKVAQAKPTGGADTASAKPKNAKEALSSAAERTSASSVRASQKGEKRVKVASRDQFSEKRQGKGGRCARAGRDVDVPAIYVVKSGDTLWDISRRYYDKGIRFEKIVRANQDKIDSPDLIYPCQKFFLPGRSALYWVLPMDDLDASSGPEAARDWSRRTWIVTLPSNIW